MRRDTSQESVVQRCSPRTSGAYALLPAECAASASRAAQGQKYLLGLSATDSVFTPSVTRYRHLLLYGSVYSLLPARKRRSPLEEWHQAARNLPIGCGS